MRTTRLLAVLGLLLGLLVGLLVGLGTTSPASAAADRDCGDFATQAAAQSFFIDHGGPRDDPHRLDDDGDGVACESNPCPCSTSQGGGNGGGNGTGPSQPPVQRQLARVVKVVDGDTVRVRIVRGRQRDVRLLGIDTPEVHGGVECGGRAASAALKRKLRPGMHVTLVSDRTQRLNDRYGRMLRYVMRGRLDAGKAQVRTGMAQVYVVGRRFTRHPAYAAAQRQARRADRGSWATCW